jgi:hypothetical protein
MLEACNSYLFFADAETTTASQRAERLNGALKEASLALRTPVSEDPFDIFLKMRVGEDGNTSGYYIDHPEFYCDLEEEKGVWSVYFRDKKTDQEVFEEQSNKPTRSEILSWIEDRSSWGSDDYLGRVAHIVEEALAHWPPKTRRGGAVSPSSFCGGKAAIIKETEERPHVANTTSHPRPG